MNSFKKYKVHDENEVAQIGDIVEVFEGRPLSKTKYYIFISRFKSSCRIKGEIMLQELSWCKVADNSGAREVMVIRLMNANGKGSTGKRFAMLAILLLFLLKMQFRVQR